MTNLMIEAGSCAPDALVTRTGGVPLAPAGTAWPRCASCGCPMRFLAQIVLDDLQGGDSAGGRGVLALFACQDDPGMCDDWEADSGGNRALLLPLDGLEPLPQPEADEAAGDDAAGDEAARDDAEDEDTEDGDDEDEGEPLVLDVVRAVAVQQEDTDDYSLAREEWAARTARPVLAVLGQLGGRPLWLQADQTPSCPACDRAMSFVAQLEEGPDRQNGMNFGGGGLAYAFVCEPCDRAAFLWQC